MADVNTLTQGKDLTRDFLETVTVKPLNTDFI